MQKKIIKSLVLIAIGSALLFLGVRTSQAAPGPFGLAINTQTKECAGYWPGDEFVGYPLPEGWKAYYPTYEENSNRLWEKIQTEVGECSFQIRKEGACCMELGYRFVSDNIGKGYGIKLRDRESLGNQSKILNDRTFRRIVILSVLVIIVVIFYLLFRFIRFLFRKLRNRKTKG